MTDKQLHKMSKAYAIVGGAIMGYCFYAVGKAEGNYFGYKEGAKSGKELGYLQCLNDLVNKVIKRESE